MPTDEVELLARQRSSSADASRIIDSLPVEARAGGASKSMIDFGERFSEEISSTDESPLIRVFLSGMNWAAFAIAIGAVLFLTWAVGESVIR